MNISDLSPNYPIFDESTVFKLKQFNIKTLPELLAKDAEHVANILDMSYLQVAKLLDELMVQYCGFSVSALEIYHRSLQNEILFKCGAPGLDSILSGGFKTGNIYNVFGPPGAGKTQLAFSLAVSGILMTPNIEVAYLDTKNDLAPHRVLQILHARSKSDGRVTLLNKILVDKCFNAEAVCKSLSEVISRLKQREGQVRLVILDNLVSPILAVLTEDIATAFFYSSKISQQLQELSSLGCCVFTVNNARNRGDEMVPALGKIWEGLADVRIKLDYSDDREGRKAEIVAGSKNKKSTQCAFKLDNSGVSSL